MVFFLAIVPISVPEVNLFMCSKIYPPYFNKFFIPKLIIEAIMLILALRAGIKNMRQNEGVELYISLLHILVKNSILQFIV